VLLRGLTNLNEEENRTGENDGVTHRRRTSAGDHGPFDDSRFNDISLTIVSIRVTSEKSASSLEAQVFRIHLCIIREEWDNLPLL